MNNKNDLSKYMRWIDRSDPAKWAFPGQAAKVWNAPGAEDPNIEMLDIDASVEDVQEQRLVYETGMESLYSTISRDDDATSGVFFTEQAKGCPEEPDAPEVSLRIRLPKDWKEGDKLPVLIYFFGAGFMFKSEFFDREIIDFSNDLHCAVISPDYRLHPEHKFPASLNDAHATLLWVLENADKYNLDKEKIVLTGQSGGGLLSLQLSHRLKRYGMADAIRGMVVQCPPIDDRGTGVAASITFPEGNGLTSMSCYRVYNSLLGWPNMAVSALSPEAIPNHATVEDIKGLPPLCIHIMESDPCRDGDLEYAQKYADAGMFCSSHLWGGTTHGTFVGLTTNISDDPLMVRFREEQNWNIQTFFDYDLRRPWVTE